MNKNVEKKKMENWLLFGDSDTEAASGYFIPKLQGIVEGKKIKTGVVYWLDIEEGIAMTEEEIYKLGKPDERWLQAVYANGGSLKEMNIKGVMH